MTPAGMEAALIGAAGRTSFNAAKTNNVGAQQSCCPSKTGLSPFGAQGRSASAALLQAPKAR